MKWLRNVVALVAVPALSALLVGCGGGADRPDHPYGAQQAAIGESLAVLGWNISMANLRFAADHVLIDIDAAASDPEVAPAAAEDLRFGLYGALAHPIEATGIGSCRTVAGSDVAPLSAPTPDRLTGTVCLGPIRDQSQVRGAYLYSPAERLPGTAVAYPAAFPIGLAGPTNVNDTGVILSSTSAEAWRGGGERFTQADLGDPDDLTGNGYMLLGLQARAIAEQYRDDSTARGGPMMVVVAPTLPEPGLSQACSTYGASMLILPDAALDSVHLDFSLCTQGEINEALFLATVSVIGTRAAVWTFDRDADRDPVR